ncbi:MAG: zf-HC2 domain-containing protein [Thermoactinomyces sp.]
MSEQCRAVQELLPWLLNGTLSSAEIVATLNHVKECAACKQELAFLVAVKNSAASTWRPHPDPAFSDQLWARIQAAQREVSGASPSRTGWITGISAALNQAVSPFILGRDAVRLAFRSVAAGFMKVFAVLIP